MINMRALLFIISMITSSIIAREGFIEFNGTIDHLESVLKNHTYVFIDFWASWCKPCTRLKDELEKVVRKKPDLRILLINVDQQRSLASHYQITSLPTLLFFKNGVFVKRIVGHHVSEKLLSLIEESAT